MEERLGLDVGLLLAELRQGAVHHDHCTSEQCSSKCRALLKAMALNRVTDVQKLLARPGVRLNTSVAGFGPLHVACAANRDGSLILIYLENSKFRNTKLYISRPEININIAECPPALL